MNKLRRQKTDQRVRARYMAERGIEVDPAKIAAMLERVRA